MNKPYKLLYMLDRRKGIQLHVKDQKEDVIRVIYLDPKSYEPKNKEHCPESLREFLMNEKNTLAEEELKAAQ
ncbi:hypothetical protein [Bacillus marinisedimentorum]|uniref:hypothetical protein n=1 Tax=Bacillus marinisedimentorum TaxID=1821260 RepID=UPI00087320F4|nr:hypothetical protein [Bacillus marinisedimentorum]